MSKSDFSQNSVELKFQTKLIADISETTQSLTVKIFHPKFGMLVATEGAIIWIIAAIPITE